MPTAHACLIQTRRFGARSKMRVFSVFGAHPDRNASFWCFRGPLEIHVLKPVRAIYLLRQPLLRAGLLRERVLGMVREQQVASAALRLPACPLPTPGKQLRHEDNAGFVPSKKSQHWVPKPNVGLKLGFGTQCWAKIGFWNPILG